MSDSQVNNKQEIFKTWVNAYSDGMLSWANFKLNDRGHAEDIVQETFLSAYNGYDSFKGDSHPKTWLFRILNNKIIDFYRKASHRKEKTENVDDAAAIHFTDNLFDANGARKSGDYDDRWDHSEHLLDNPEFKSVLEDCLKDLPEQWRTAILSKFILEKSGQEICQELHISPSNYWQIVHRAKLLLKTCIELKWFKEEK